VNPPPSQSTISDPVYDVGDPIDIQWVGSNSFVSVRLVHWLPDSNLDEFVYVFGRSRVSTIAAVSHLNQLPFR
jgi:hypothetical protein